MELWKKQKKILAAFGIFLGLMFLCTLISRVVYASRLPQVTVDSPRKMAISHRVEAEGIVHQGREYAINVLAGLRVRTVCARVGDKVTPETLLFELDTDDLAQKIQEQELAVKKLQLQIQDLEQNRNLDSQKQQNESTRAQEDYNRTAGEQRDALDDARDALDDAEDAYEEHKSHPVQVTPEAQRKALQAAYEAWMKKKTELETAEAQALEMYEAAQKKVEALEKELDTGTPSLDRDVEAELAAARQEEAQAKEAYESARAACETHTANAAAKPDFSAEDAALAAWNEKKASLKASVKAAEDAADKAEQESADALREAGRKVEDAALFGTADRSLEISRLELSVMQKTLADYKKVQEAGGKVYPEAEGIITRIQVSPGERVPDGAAFVYADLSSPMQFNVSLTKEQKKYVNQGDMAELRLGGSQNEVTVDYIAENEMNPELYDAYVFLPDGVGSLGQSGSFTVEAQSETFSCCIPIDALREDSNRRKYVYVVSEKSGILGTELAAEKIYVKVLDQNESYAAIEEGVIDRDTELIVTSTENLEDRDVIRYKE